MEETKKPASRKAILSVVVTVLVMAGVAAVIWHRSFKPDPFAPMYGCWMSVAGGDDFSPRHVVRIEPDRIHIDNSEEHEFRPAVVTDPMIATPHPDRAAFYSLAAGREYYVIVNTRDNTATIKESAVSLKDCRYRRISREEYDKFLVPNDLEKYYEVTYFDGDVVAPWEIFAVGESGAAAEHGLDGGVCDDGGAVLSEGGDGLAVEMVEVFVGDEKQIGFRKCGIVRGGGDARSHGIDVDFEAVVPDEERGVFEASYGDAFAVRGLENVKAGLRRGGERGSGGGKGEE